MEDFKTQQQQQQQTQEQEKKAGEIHHCKKCGATLSADDKFCPECGEKIGGEEKECRWCGTLTTKEICPECGKRVVPQICKKCGKEAYFDVCEHCGQILNSELQAFVEKKSEPVKQMSKAEAQSIIKEFEEAESEEVEYFKKKLQEHEILLAEKKTFVEREKRINKAFGENHTAIQYPDPEETKFIQEAAKSLKEAALQKEKEAIQEALEKKFPGVKSEEEEHAEFLRLMEQRDSLFKKQIAENTERIEEEIAEIQRKIEEQRRREEEIARERRRLELEAFNNRIRGTYVSTHDCPCGGYNHEDIRISFSINPDGTLTGKTISSWSEYCGYAGGKYAGTKYITSLRGNFDGNKVSFKTTSSFFEKNPNNLTSIDFLDSFCGDLNNSGVVLNGFWFSGSEANGYFDYRKY